MKHPYMSVRDMRGSSQGLRHSQSPSQVHRHLEVIVRSEVVMFPNQHKRNKRFNSASKPIRCLSRTAAVKTGSETARGPSISPRQAKFHSGSGESRCLNKHSKSYFQFRSVSRSVRDLSWYKALRIPVRL